MSPTAGLEIREQADFSQGMYRNPSPELIPEKGFADAINALLEEDGAIYRRGGSVFKSNANFAAALTFIWDGFVAGGSPRTLFASAAAFGTFAADDTTPVSLGANGTDGQRAASGSGLVHVPEGSSGPAGTIASWGGSRKTAVYSTGTVTAALLNRVVTGAGTLWNANADAGMLLFTSGGLFVGVVASVDSDTQITLHDFAQTAVTAGAYSLFVLVSQTPAGAVPVFVGAAGDPARLLVGSRNRVQFSAAGNPFSFAATDYHQMPEGQIVGLAGLQDQAFVFTTAGVYVISNLNYNLIDAAGNVQQRLSQLTKDVTLLDARGIAGYRNQLVVPGVDDIWLMGPAQFPEPISDPIRSLYRAYVQAGCLCGIAAVYRNHYILPIIQANAWIDTLVYRLDQGGWTRWQGHGGTALGFTQRSSQGSRRPQLLSANAARVVDMSGAWQPIATIKNDADGTTQQFQVTTRDYASGQASNSNFVKKLRVRYELDDAGDAPTMQAFYGSGRLLTSGPLWGAATWASFIWGGSANPGFVPLKGSANNGDAPANSGTDPFPWLVGQQAPNFYRFRLICSSPTPNLVIREVDSFVRVRSRQ
jgi:hypothetical protein